jgi:hypothetical protein
MIWIWIITALAALFALGGLWYGDKGWRKVTWGRALLSLVVLASCAVSIHTQLQDAKTRETAAQHRIEEAKATITLLRHDSVRTAEILARTDTIAKRALAAESRAEARAHDLQTDNKTLRSQLSDAEARLEFQTLQLSLAERPALTNPTAQFSCYYGRGPSGFDLSTPCGGTSGACAKGLRWSLRVDIGNRWRTTMKNYDCDSVTQRQDLFPGTSYHPLYEQDINTGLKPYVSCLCWIGRWLYSGLFVGSTFDGQIQPSNIYNYCVESRLGAELTLEFPVFPSRQGLDSLLDAWKPMMQGADIRICLNPAINEFLVLPLCSTTHIFDRSRKQARLFWGQSALPYIENSEVHCAPPELFAP